MNIFTDQENVRPKQKPSSSRRKGLQAQARPVEKKVVVSQLVSKPVDSLIDTHNQYEANIQQYQGSDPLSAWTSYIAWVQQTYKSKPTELHSQLLPILNACINEFSLNKTYTNNRKYLKLWILYADQSGNGEEVFKKLKSLGVGGKLAMMYQVK